jgi:hypothetical protein
MEQRGGRYLGSRSPDHLSPEETSFSTPSRPARGRGQRWHGSAPLSAPPASSVHAPVGPSSARHCSRPCPVHPLAMERRVSHRSRPIRLRPLAAQMPTSSAFSHPPPRRSSWLRPPRRRPSVRVHQRTLWGKGEGRAAVDAGRRRPEVGGVCAGVGERRHGLGE